MSRGYCVHGPGLPASPARFASSIVTVYSTSMPFDGRVKRTVVESGVSFDTTKRASDSFARMIPAMSCASGSVLPLITPMCRSAVIGFTPNSQPAKITARTSSFVLRFVGMATAFDSIR